MRGRKNDDSSPRLTLRCPECGYGLQITATTKSKTLFPIKAPTRYLKPLDENSQISAHGTAAFLREVTKRGWSMFTPITLDTGIDYVIAKEYTTVMIQLKAATKDAEKSIM